ncbi:hypothetical protein RGUI_1042 [Rhodovulum sp. P5]|nr:hypothetical protein RGUI_1042 [Rhodovulum sp. P5]
MSWRSCVIWPPKPINRLPATIPRKAHTTPSISGCLPRWWDW